MGKKKNQKKNVKHLDEKMRVKFGVYYTPQHIVNVVIELIQPYIHENQSNTIIVDFAVGTGSFLEPILQLNNVDYRVVDIDKIAIEYIKSHYPQLDVNKVFNVNSLKHTNRKDFNIDDDQFLIVVGNPPYNDVSSIYKRKLKVSGTHHERHEQYEIPREIFDKDVGISFLKFSVS